MLTRPARHLLLPGILTIAASCVPPQSGSTTGSTIATTHPGATTSAIASEDEAFVGTWVIQSAVENGVEQADFKGMKFTFKGGQVKGETASAEPLAGGYKLNTLTNPKSIDLGLVIGDFLVTHPGLYVVSGDDMTICLSRDFYPLQGDYGGNRPPQPARPTKVDGSAGTNCSLWTLRRLR